MPIDDALLGHELEQARRIRFRQRVVDIGFAPQFHGCRETALSRCDRAIQFELSPGAGVDVIERLPAGSVRLQ
ncbi:hypothetical protein D3C78_1744700 [compost metagenome]